MIERIKNNPIVNVLTTLVRRYFLHGISRTGAELAYFFLFSFFSLIIFLTSLVGKLNIDITEMIHNAKYVIPADIISLIDEYIAYLASIKSEGLMYTGIALTIYFFTRSVNALLYAFNRSYGVKENRNTVLQLLMSLLCTVMLMVLIIATLLLLVSGKSFFQMISSMFHIEIYYVNIWNVLRFVIAAFFFLFVLVFFYVVLPNKKIKLKQALPGAFTAMIVWISVSIAFSFYVENMGRYSFLYGSIGAIMVLMLWLYLTGTILVMGAELNSVIDLYLKTKTEFKMEKEKSISKE